MNAVDAPTAADPNPWPSSIHGSSMRRLQDWTLRLVLFHNKNPKPSRAGTKLGCAPAMVESVREGKPQRPGLGLNMLPVNLPNQID